MQTIKVNNKIFRSISKAAHFLNLNVSTFAKMVKNKQAITYKDLLIEKTNPVEPVKKRKQAPKKPIPVIVDGVAYNSCAEAEQILGLPPCVVSKALRYGRNSYNGIKIEPVFPSRIKRVVKKVQVYCVDTQTTYDSIREAARVAMVDEWTMSKKMETSGCFIDGNGHIYKRLRPMRTKNTYANTGSRLTIKKRPSHKTVKDSLTVENPEPITVVPVDNKTVAEKTPVCATKKDVPQIVKDAINDKIMKLLKDREIYDEIIELLNYGGFSTIKIDK